MKKFKDEDVCYTSFHDLQFCNSWYNHFIFIVYILEECKLLKIKY